MSAIFPGSNTEHFFSQWFPDVSAGLKANFQRRTLHIECCSEEPPPCQTAFWRSSASCDGSRQRPCTILISLDAARQMHRKERIRKRNKWVFDEIPSWKKSSPQALIRPLGRGKNEKRGTFRPLHTSADHDHTDHDYDHDHMIVGNDHWSPKLPTEGRAITIKWSIIRRSF